MNFCQNGETMKIFEFSIERHAEAFRKDGFVHIENGVTPEFMKLVRLQAIESLATSKGLVEWKIPKKKQQFIFEFPSQLEIEKDLMDWVNAVTGFGDRQRTICERHIKSYDDTADPMPEPHLDRSASEVAIGIPIDVAPDSHLLIYPSPRLSNPYSSTAAWRSSGMHAEIADKLDPSEAIRIYDKPGDVIMFLGSSLLHERINSAGTTILYFKVNAAGLDPMAEDPRFEEKVNKSIARRAHFNRAGWPACYIISLAPTFEKLSVEKFRPGWQEVHHAHFWGKDPVPISAEEAKLISCLEAPRKVDELSLTLGMPHTAQSFAKMLDRLFQLGIILL